MQPLDNAEKNTRAFIFLSKGAFGRQFSRQNYFEDVCKDTGIERYISPSKSIQSI